MAYTQVKNHQGIYVKPSAETFKAAASGAAWSKAKDFYLILTDAPGKDSWPIAGSTFILMYKKQDKPEQAKEALRFFQWAYHKGDKLAQELDYVPLPDSVVKLIESKWKTEIKTADGKKIDINK